jgi:hypothetical protein
MASPGSVTRWVAQLQSPDAALRDEAARQIWVRYFSSLLEVADRNLDRRLKRRTDEEDVALCVCKSFFVRMQQGAYQLANRDDLWRLLVTMTLNKARGAAALHRTARRNYQREEAGRAGAAGGSFTQDEAMAQLEQVGPSPEEALMWEEEVEKRLAVLDVELRRVARWKLEGFTNVEIAGPDKLDCAVRTVERKLESIRARWEEMDG